MNITGGAVMLNNYMWQLYMRSGGENTVKIFEDNFTKGMKREYTDMITKLHLSYHVCDSILADECEQLNNLCDIYQSTLSRRLTLIR